MISVLLAVLVSVIVVLSLTVVWLLRDGPSGRRWTVDLAPAVPVGELDLDWSDPRGRAGLVSPVEQAELDADWVRRRDGHRARLAAVSSA